MNQEIQPVPNPSRGEAMKAALLSALVIPGAGQLYNRQWLKGTLVIVLFLFSSLGVLIPLTLGVIGYYLSLGAEDMNRAAQSLQLVSQQWIHLLVLALVAVGVYLYSIIDAYRQRIRNKSVQENI